MNKAQLADLARHNRAFCHLDNFVIVNTATGLPIESWFNRSKADHFCQVVNDHEARNNRPAIYEVQEVEK